MSRSKTHEEKILTARRRQQNRTRSNLQRPHHTGAFTSSLELFYSTSSRPIGLESLNTLSEGQQQTFRATKGQAKGLPTEIQRGQMPTSRNSTWHQTLKPQGKCSPLSLEEESELVAIVLELGVHDTHGERPLQNLRAANLQHALLVAKLVLHHLYLLVGQNTRAN